MVTSKKGVAHCPVRALFFALFGCRFGGEGSSPSKSLYLKVPVPATMVRKPATNICVVRDSYLNVSWEQWKEGRKNDVLVT